MAKVSLAGGNTFCPQALYLYGTIKEDGRADYGLFCWCCYCFAGDAMKFVACIAEDKLTRDRIRATGMLSATVVTEDLLSRADFCGCTDGRTCDKESVIASDRGDVLPVPVPRDGMWTLELRVEDTLHPENQADSEIYICSIVNVRAEEVLTGDTPFDEKMAALKPVVTLGGKYYAVGTQSLGDWGIPMKLL